ncbi:chemotaxis protein [Spongiibacter sp. KMU-158]|uniref:Chemotaxis protein n=1 Tax=Spongiibacter pelagi TaxID=2760804 RepID=A0A927C0F4_9GAMM|nr:methyl-accepting chemotaxis protein [Spongiibacter pelagi]MBD2857381.1 chemotaxis protein [Spongiibacter pelagi]
MALGNAYEARFRGNRTAVFLMVLIVVSFVAAAINSYIVLRNANFDQRYLELSSEMRLYSQQLATASGRAAAGDAPAFEVLSRAQRNFETVRRELVSGGDEMLSPAKLLGDRVQQLNKLWDELYRATNTIIDSREEILSVYEVTAEMKRTLPQLQEYSNQVVALMVRNNAKADQVAIAQRQAWLLERMSNSTVQMHFGDKAANTAGAQFGVDANEFGAVLAGLMKGNKAINIDRVDNREAQNLLSRISTDFQSLSASVSRIFEVAPQLLAANEAAMAIVNNVPEVTSVTSSLSGEIAKLDSKRVFTVKTAILFGALTFIGLALLALQSVRNSRRRLATSSEANEKNQAAILRLLDELADLADGDLTASATVTEDFTGAIADSINFTIDQLRVLVSQINETAQEVSKAAQSTQSTALELAEASESQAREITGATSAIGDMRQIINKVSNNARDSAAVAERSVGIANNGSLVVQNTIKGMDNIREQIQDTSKRIKRLGESSQEIGDIVSLINDIADQTNILALNAAIQASMAGDAGRGFAVVADEVQRLAERSSAATRQIEALVKTIQSDTNEAVISMEQTTSEVVRGANLAQDAGQALTEIESVSQELAGLIEAISGAANDQTRSAEQIAGIMEIIQRITDKTSSGTKETAQSIGALAEITNDLRSSVAGFTLPNPNR